VNACTELSQFVSSNLDVPWQTMELFGLQYRVGLYTMDLIPEKIPGKRSTSFSVLWHRTRHHSQQPTARVRSEHVFEYTQWEQDEPGRLAGGRQEVGGRFWSWHAYHERQRCAG